MEEERILSISGTISLHKTENRTNNVHKVREIVTLLITKMEDIINYAQINKISIYEAMFEYFENGTLSLQDIFDLAGMFICEMRDNN